MNEIELHYLAEGRVIEIGAHTAAHPRLSALAPCEQFDEVRRGKVRREEILGSNVTRFSSPFGGTFDVSAANVAAVRKAGFARACTTRHGMVRRRTNLLRLTRLQVGTWSGDDLERRLNLWFPS